MTFRYDRSSEWLEADNLFWIASIKQVSVISPKSPMATRRTRLAAAPFKPGRSEKHYGWSKAFYWTGMEKYAKEKKRAES